MWISLCHYKNCSCWLKILDGHVVTVLFDSILSRKSALRKWFLWWKQIVGLNSNVCHFGSSPGPLKHAYNFLYIQQNLFFWRLLLQMAGFNSSNTFSSIDGVVKSYYSCNSTAIKTRGSSRLILQCSYAVAHQDTRNWFTLPVSICMKDGSKYLTR